jgi:SAM-dependent methyltransferase
VEPRDPTPSAQTQTQDEVVDVYNRLATDTGPLSDWDYLTTKQLTDAEILHHAGIDGADVLNMGCHVPLDEIEYAHRVKSWTATDLGEDTIRAAEETARLHLSDELFERLRFEVADGTKLPYPDGSFDVTVSFSTVDHVPTPEGRQKFVDEMARVTRPGGRVVLTVPNRWHRGYAKSPKPFYEYGFSPPEIRRMVQSTGLEITRFTSSSEIPVLAPRLLLSRFQRRPLLSIYNRLARELGVRMGVLAVKR